MKQGMKAAASIDEYISGFPKDVQAQLHKMRDTIHRAAPQAGEAIKYGLATFTFHGNLVHFGAFKTHIGFYPAPGGIKEFQKELAKYDGSKGTIRFPIDKPLPLALISRIVKFRVKQTLEKQKMKELMKKENAKRKK
ncbi:MAG TPA: DUF1801 domain-containing protein [Cyclobacteriaceae bacterium]|nr:DUF1801 domain-containing protein [Cyclobacteriaceae bacterium]